MNESDITRLKTLDGFRCIALVGVIAYHFFYRFSPPLTAENYYPYQTPTSIFRYGFYGVQFFFVISGFVICLTLFTTNSFRLFMIKRLVRLWPTLLLCSLITYFFVELFDSEYRFPFFHVPVVSFLPTLTFISPAIWNQVLHIPYLSFIDGVYWSLFAEMIFYITAATFFFLRGPEKFLNDWMLFVLSLFLIRVLTSPKLFFLFPADVHGLFDAIYRMHFTLNFNYFSYFALGIFSYYLFSKQTVSKTAVVSMVSIACLELYFLHDLTLRLMFISIVALFGLLIFNERWLKFLANPWFTWIGLISYPLYLLHENIGLILIHFFGGKLSPFIVLAILILLSSIIFVYFERPLIAYFKGRIVHARNTSSTVK